MTFLSYGPRSGTREHLVRGVFRKDLTPVEWLAVGTLAQFDCYKWSIGGTGSKVECVKFLRGGVGMV